jgi:hypothetical protein
MQQRNPGQLIFRFCYASDEFLQGVYIRNTAHYRLAMAVLRGRIWYDESDDPMGEARCENLSGEINGEEFIEYELHAAMENARNFDGYFYGCRDPIDFVRNIQNWARNIDQIVGSITVVVDPSGHNLDYITDGAHRAAFLAAYNDLHGVQRQINIHPVNDPGWGPVRSLTDRYPNENKEEDPHGGEMLRLRRLAGNKESHCLVEGERLSTGECLSSPNRIYTLQYRKNGNLCIYKKVFVGPTRHYQCIWSTNTQGKGRNGRLQIEDGHLVLSSNGETIQKIPVSPGSKLAMQDDGNLVIYNVHNEAEWSSQSDEAHRNNPNKHIPRRYMKGPDGLEDQYAAPSSLFSGERLRPGECLISPNKKYKLRYQTDGNLCIYQIRDQQGHIIQARCIWATGTGGTTLGTICMQPDGNFVLYSAGVPIQATMTHHFLGSIIMMQDDGNLVIYNTDNQPTWASNTDQQSRQSKNIHPRQMTGRDGFEDTYAGKGSILPSGFELKPGQFLLSRNRKYKLRYQLDGNLCIYEIGQPNKCIWAAGTNRKSVEKTDRLRMQEDGSLVLYSGGDDVWKAGIGNDISYTIAMEISDRGALRMYSQRTGATVWSSESPPLAPKSGGFFPKPQDVVGPGMGLPRNPKPQRKIDPLNLPCLRPLKLIPK